MKRLSERQLEILTALRDGDAHTGELCVRLRKRVQAQALWVMVDRGLVVVRGTRPVRRRQECVQVWGITPAGVEALG